jgi:hypothetical protein
MKNVFLFALLLGLSAGVAANEFIPYYGNNPFLFCTYGVPEDCWVPKHKETGQYRVIDRKCFKPWSANLYSRVCKQAFPNGAVDNTAPGEAKPLGSGSTNQYSTTDPNASANMPRPAVRTLARDPADASP